MNDPNWKLPEVPIFKLTSPDFTEGESLPQWARSDGAGGQNRSPALSWDDVPEGTKSFALTCYDPDAPTGSGYWHWAIYNLPASLRELPADAGNPEAKLLPDGVVTLPNESRNERFEGAGPPAGHGPHRYFFTLSALSVKSLELPPRCTPAILGFSLRPYLLGRAQLMGTSETK